MGTLGTGNHFIEICLDETNQVWAMLHSGSRGCGNRIGMYFIECAKKEMERWFRPTLHRLAQLGQQLQQREQDPIGGM